MQDSFRRSTLALPILVSPLAVAAAAVASYTVQNPAVITAAQLAATDSGTGAGALTVAIKVNGNTISQPSIAGGAASVTASAAISSSTPAAYPQGYVVKPGDVITVVITAVPGTTVPKGATAYLEVVQRDI